MILLKLELCPRCCRELGADGTCGDTQCDGQRYREMIASWRTRRQLRGSKKMHRRYKQWREIQAAENDHGSDDMFRALEDAPAALEG